MKILNKIGLVLFSTLILLEGLALCLCIAGWMDLSLINNVIKFIVTDNIGAKVSLGISVLLVLLATKCIFLNSDDNNGKNSKDGILLENESGKLLVSRDTIESLANSVVKNYDTAQNVMTRVELDNENNVSIFITLFVYPDAIIKDLTVSIQRNIKETVKKSLDLEVRDVNVKIKNIATKKEAKE